MYIYYIYIYIHIYTVIYIYNCRQNCFGLLGLISAVLMSRMEKPTLYRQLKCSTLVVHRSHAICIYIYIYIYIYTHIYIYGMAFFFFSAGHPNVGKSSLLNGLIGKKVRGKMNKLHFTNTSKIVGFLDIRIIMYENLLHLSF